MGNVWSSANAKVKRYLAEKMEFILTNTPLNLTINEHRLRVLEELIRERMRVITPRMYSTFIAQIFSKVADAINLVDLVF